MRRAIADRMSQANRDIPHYFLERQVDLSALMEHLSAVNADLDVADRLVPAAAFVRATALAAARHGELNGHWIDDEFLAGTAVNVAVAISLAAAAWSPRRSSRPTPSISLPRWLGSRQ